MCEIANILRKEFTCLTLILYRAIMYKAPAQNTGKALIAGAAGAWQDTAAVTGANGHSFAKALEHVIAPDNTNKFIVYNNIPPDIPKVKTKSNSKGVLMMNPNAADDASWIVHTVPGFPKALRGYVFPPAEIQKGHLFICFTIKGSEIDAIAMALRIATPLIYHNDIPDAEINSRPNLKKLVNGESRLTPPLTVTRQISTADAAGLKVTIYSKSEKSKYEIYRRVLVKKLKTGIKVWTTRDKILKSDCRILNRNIKLVTSPIAVDGHASSLESDASQWLISEPGNKFCVIDKPYHIYRKVLVKKLKTGIKVWTPRDKILKSDCRILNRNIKLVTGPITIGGHASFLESDVSQWLISEPGNKFCAVDKPYQKSQAKEPAMAVCIDDATIFGHFNVIAPAQNIGKALIAGVNANAWQNTQDLTGLNNHAVVKSLEHVIMANAANKFIAYSNIPPDVPKVKTKSNSKGVLMMNPNVEDEASWIVHTIPGFPKALRGYEFPPAEIQKGHLFICLTIKESEIDAIAMALRIATPLIYHNDIPDDPARPNLKKLVNGESRLTPPLTVTQQISTAAAQGLKMTIYSKNEKSKYEIYRRVLVKKLKTGIKVWTTRDKTLKSDCRILNRNIKLVTSPITIGDHPSSLESDVSQWLISEPGNKFCVIDKPYHKSQTKEPAMAVCINDATIFGHFNRIGQNKQHQNVITQMVLRKQIDTPDLTVSPGNVVAKPLEHVIAANDANKFIAYNNIPPDIPKVKTKSNSKGVLMMNPQGADEAAWIVHTVPGFPKALRGYVFPPAEIQKGHLFICLTIKESEIDAIAMALRIATPLIYHNDIPDSEINSRPNLKKLVNGESRLTPPLTVTRQISTAAAAGLKVAIYSKGEKSKYVTSPITIGDHASSLESDVSHWLISDPGNKFCAVDKPYHKSQTIEPAMAVCIDDATIFAPGQNIGKAFTQGNAGAWQDTAVVTGVNGHSFGKALEHNKQTNLLHTTMLHQIFQNQKQNQTAKGVLMMNPQGADEAAWIVHTVPGFPKALRGYLFPPEEIQKGHLFICLTIKESEIDAIAMTTRIATPLIYHNDIPDSEIDSRPNLKKLVNGESRFIPPLTVTRDISTAAPGGLKVTIYSKGEKSRFEIYRRILVRKLKTTIKIWTTRDKTLKSDCRIFGRNIRLVTSPISVSGHPSSLESDVSQWLISDPGNKFCAVDKPYHKSQTKEPGMAVCIDDASIFTRFNEIAANLDNCT
ncbi:Plancitoxin-1 [Trichinella nelsoni]|uniref:Plancitoxin-1 n=1 Tax=Trichinella nelsoni TaxID=6336 RepID=A0A0V0RKX2_9BILA|nr:Plancitoxin-1 [Trichinella nelsoni]